MKLKKIGLSEAEVVEIWEDESLGINKRGNTTVDFISVWRCVESEYKIGDKYDWGTKLITYDGYEIIVEESYKDCEAFRREMKNEYIKSQAILIGLNQSKE